MGTPRRGNKLIQCRLKPAGQEWADKVCGQLKITRSDLLRYALSYAATTPAGFAKHVRAQQQAHHKE